MSSLYFRPWPQKYFAKLFIKVMRDASVPFPWLAYQYKFCLHGKFVLRKYAVYRIR